jgi:hypothetical protein
MNCRLVPGICDLAIKIKRADLAALPRRCFDDFAAVAEWFGERAAAGIQRTGDELF